MIVRGVAVLERWGENWGRGDPAIEADYVGEFWF